MDDETEATVAVRAFVRAVDGDDEAVDELADLAVGQDWIAGWVADAAAAISCSGLP